MADYLLHVLLAFAALAMFEVFRSLAFDRDH
jgi:hypothetical protein